MVFFLLLLEDDLLDGRRLFEAFLLLLDLESLYVLYVMAAPELLDLPEDEIRGTRSSASISSSSSLSLLPVLGRRIFSDDRGNGF